MLPKKAKQAQEGRPQRKVMVDGTKRNVKMSTKFEGTCLQRLHGEGQEQGWRPVRNDTGKVERLGVSRKAVVKLWIKSWRIPLRRTREMREEIKSRSSSKQRRSTDGWKRGGTDAGQEIQNHQDCAAPRGEHSKNCNLQTSTRRDASNEMHGERRDGPAGIWGEQRDRRSKNHSHQRGLFHQVTDSEQCSVIDVIHPVKCTNTAMTGSGRIRNEKTHMCLKKEREAKRIG